MNPRPYQRGTKISEPGFYSGVPISTYHGADLCDGPSVSSSGLRTIWTKSPAHFWDQSRLNPNRAAQAETESFTLGRAAHHLLLGEAEFSVHFIGRPEIVSGKPWQGNRTECKAWLKAQEKAGRTVLTHEQIDQIRGMARSLASHGLVQAGILNGLIEHTMCWQDEETGIWCLSRPDVIPSDSGDVADLKGTSAVGFDLDRSIQKYRYDMQAAMVRRGLKATLGIEMASFSLVFVEFKRPHCVDVLSLHGEDIARADADLQVALRVFKHCLETGNWFGPSGTQSDARFASLSDAWRMGCDDRKAFLEREIAQ